MGRPIQTQTREACHCFESGLFNRVRVTKRWNAFSQSFSDRCGQFSSYEETWILLTLQTGRSDSMRHHVKLKLLCLSLLPNLCPAPSLPPSNPLPLTHLVHHRHPHIHLYYLASISCLSNYLGSHRPTLTALPCAQ